MVKRSMSYHKFPNLGQQFQSDLTSQLKKDLKSMDFMDLLCNCNKALQIDRKCMYKGDWRKYIVVYNAKYVKCRTMGIPSKKLKTRINQHLNEVCAFVIKVDIGQTMGEIWNDLYE